MTIPYIGGGLSHLLPLLSFHHNYIRQNNKIENYFLVGDIVKSIFRRNRIKTLKSDYNIDSIIEDNVGTSSRAKKIRNIEILELNKLKPDLLLEDFCYNSPILSKKYNIPRISIQRTGMFRSVDNEDRMAEHRHSLFSGLNDCFGNEQFNQSSISEELTLDSYTKADIKIIPGIPSIESLPKHLNGDKSYFYCGPLLVKDKPSPTFLSSFQNYMVNNQGKRKAYITTGLVDQTDIKKYCEILLKNDFSIITNHDFGQWRSNRIFYKKIIPLNYLFKFIDLVIHHCGSGMYHYPILYGLPSITIGTRCYDREDIAQRLESLNISKHVPHVLDNKNYLETFQENLNLFFKDKLVDYKSINSLKKEILETKASFKMSEVLEQLNTDRE